MTLAPNSDREEMTDDDNEELSATSGEDSDQENQEEEEGEDVHTNLGWASLISKILNTNKAKGKKSLVLSKAKKLSDVAKKRKKEVFEILTESGETKAEEEDVEEDEAVVKAPKKRTKKELPHLRVKPNILERDKERRLAKIATKGVVQLFNAVQTQQKDIDMKLKEVGPTERKREKVLNSIDKKKFLDVLMGEAESSSNRARPQTAAAAVSAAGETSWRVLRDDFMVGAKLKDWDKEVEEESEREIEMECG